MFEKLGDLTILVNERGGREEISIDKKTRRGLFRAMGMGLKDLFGILQRGVSVSRDAVEFLAENKHRYLSVLNGVMGDTLCEKNSPLAIEMSLLGEARGGKLCILVHGLCDSEEAWHFREDPTQSYGSLLQEDLGFSPLFLRYNSGLHISTNGRLLARLLSKICGKKSDPLREIIFIGHSMGGLVVRSACHYGQEKGASWVKHVKKVFFLGTPHLGADYEKIGHLTSKILKMIPNPVTWGIAALGNRRSAGIKDLRFGYLLDEDWKGHDADVSWKDHRHPVALLPGVDYYLIAGALAKEWDNVFTQYFGDGMVPSRSAAGRSFLKSKSLSFLSDHLRTVRGLSHKGLAHHKEVYQHIREWCR